MNPFFNWSLHKSLPRSLPTCVCRRHVRASVVDTRAEFKGTGLRSSSKGLIFVGKRVAEWVCSSAQRWARIRGMTRFTVAIFSVFDTQGVRGTNHSRTRPVAQIAFFACGARMVGVFWWPTESVYTYCSDVHPGVSWDKNETATGSS